MGKQELFDEMYRGAGLGAESIEVIKNFVDDRPMLNILNNQKREFVALKDELEQEGAASGVNLTPVQFADKAKIWGAAIVNTISDKSLSKIAEVLIDGRSKGIIKLTRAKNRSDEDSPYADRLMNIYKNHIETYKLYL
jgi:hypothetical protein